MSLEECGLPKIPLQTSLMNRRRVLQTGVAAAALSGLGQHGRAAAQDATPVAALTPSDADLIAGLPAFIEATMKTYDVPGVAVTLVRDGETLFEQGFGVRELGKPETIDADSQFQLASNSKPMTAAAIGALVDAERDHVRYRRRRCGDGLPDGRPLPDPLLHHPRSARPPFWLSGVLWRCAGAAGIRPR